MENPMNLHKKWKEYMCPEAGKNVKKSYEGRALFSRGVTPSPST